MKTGPSQDFRSHLVYYRVLFFKTTAIVGFIAVAYFGVRNVLTFDLWLGVVELIVAGLALLSLTLYYWTNKISAPSNILVSAMFGLLIVIFARGGIADAGLLWFSVFPVISHLLLTSRPAILWNLLLAASVVFVFTLRENGVLMLDFQVPLDVFIQFISHFVVVNILVGAGAYTYGKEEEVLTEQYLQLEKVSAERARLAQSVIKQDEDIKQGVEVLEDTKMALLNVLEDVEEEKAKLNQQVIETQRFKQVVEEATDGVIMVTPDYQVTYVNKQLEKFTGYSLPEIRKKGEHPLIDKAKTEARVRKSLHENLDAGRGFITEDIFMLRKGGDSFQVRMSIFPIVVNEKVQFFVSIVQDITKRKEIERAKTEFVSLASHELRTPLSGVNWYTELLLAGGGGKLTKKQHEYLSDIYEGNQRMVELVNSLLNVSRLELGTFIVTPKKENILEIVQTAIDELTPNFKEKGITVVKKLAKEFPPMQLDKKLTMIVLQNLITNAIKYTPSGGKITVTAGKDEEEKNLLVSVSDTGWGIPPHQQDRVFDKLFRADNVRINDTVGTGLGLYICKSILDAAGGEIWFKSPVTESTTNPGTTFFFSIPLSGMSKREGTRRLT